METTPADVKQRLDAGEKLVLLDCREPQEWALTRIEGAELIPMNTVPQRLQHIEGLADEATVIVYCHHGMRSLSVVDWLRRQGVENCQSMAGGIEYWSTSVDPSVPRY
jgi:rhodanese-related sulfurtransferase